MNGPIRRAAVGLLTAMTVLLLAVTWHQVVRADDLRNHRLNPRPALAERGKERGLIVTVDGAVVARSTPSETGRDYRRQYPEGPAFAHVVGFSSFLVGETGLEAAYSPKLRSRRDLTISDLVAAILGQDLRPHSLEITIDSRLQRVAFDALGESPGAVAALDPKTGAVLALASTPAFDPRLLGGDDASSQWEALLADADEPLIDRATKEIYAPGSTFKTVVAAAALDTGWAGPGTVFDDPDEFDLPDSTAAISNFDGGPCGDGGTVTLLEAFVRSCNTVFADLSIQLGATDIAAVAEALGFNGDIEFEWAVPKAVWPTDDLLRDDAALAQSGIGERDVRAAPLHMAMVAAAVAAEGAVSRPFMVRRILDSDGETVDATEPAERGRAMAPETASVLAEMMERVVTEGTGRRAAVPGVRVAGKTGTATGKGGFPNPWFIGFAPVEDPTIALVVLVEGSPVSGESATGGSVAAPIASKLFSAWLSRP